jgi:hypothetical protein
MKVATTEPHSDRKVLVIALTRPEGEVNMPLKDGHMIHRKIVPIIAVMSLLYDAPLEAERSSRIPTCCSDNSAVTHVPGDQRKQRNHTPSTPGACIVPLSTPPRGRNTRQTLR